jgi:hypothetical protein
MNVLKSQTANGQELSSNKEMGDVLTRLEDSFSFGQEIINVAGIPK